MGLNKYGKDKWEDVSDWTTTMICAKIREIENEKEQARKEYADRCAFLNEQYEILQNEISNRWKTEYMNKKVDMVEVVRCKDCKHGESGACGYGIDCDGVWHDDDWFCADGERNEGR